MDLLHRDRGRLSGAEAVGNETAGHCLREENNSESAFDQRGQLPVVTAVTETILVLTRIGLGRILVPGDR